MGGGTGRGRGAAGPPRRLPAPRRAGGGRARRREDGDAVAEVIRAAFSLGPRQAAAQDLEFAVRQLVEVGVRALSPGINDPSIAIAVLDRLAAALCEVAPRCLPNTTVLRGGQVVLHRRVTDYAGLCDAMFHMVRKNASGSPAVLIRLLETLERVMTVEARPERRAELVRHADLALSAGRIVVEDPADVAILKARRAALPAADARPQAVLR
ncbi:DUF2254 family protein [Dankookia rubra]|uniref:DUF2254 family protein n=1 Tax=Dankookia rubra TaxID=1442381 RepID=UPI00240D633E|nr:DUF2254 family protein [Dankookia rubra]